MNRRHDEGIGPIPRGDYDGLRSWAQGEYVNTGH